MEPTLESRLTRVLRRWENQRVAVRIVADRDDLLATFAGTLRPGAHEEHPPFFWPVECDFAADLTVERRGIYVHPELLTDLEVHVGGWVVDYVQAGVTVNMRRL